MLPRRALIAAALLATVLTSCSTDDGPEDDRPAGKNSAIASSSAGEGNGSSLAAAVDKLPVAGEHREGYERDKFKLWVDADHDGCDTRKEVLLAEAVKKPSQSGECSLSGGSWTSYYDGKDVSNPRGLDIDHVVPLAEAWDSGAWHWDTERRETYANDLSSQTTLVAVTLTTNRSKGDQDPAEWLPPSKTSHCRYAAEWTAIKLHFKLTADQAEKTALKKIAADCPDTDLPAIGTS